MTSAPSNGSNGYISRGNMSVILSAAGLVMVAFGAFITFQNSATDRRISDLKDMVAVIEKDYLRKDEHLEFKLRVDKELTRLDTDNLRRASAVVPRTEHQARWDATDGTLKLLSERLNELRTATTSTVTVRDELTRLHADLNELRRQLMAGERK